MSNLYQSSTGVTPVTADGQPVGLVLDKSRGGLFGDELIPSNDFTGWVSEDTSVFNVETDGTVTVNDGNGINHTFLTSPLINLEIGKTYFVEITSNNNTGDGLGIYTNLTGGPNGYYWNRYFVFTCTLSPSRLNLFRFRGHTGTGTLNNISVKQVLGNHGTQPVATQRPTYNANPDRLTLDLVDDSLLVTIPTGGWDGYMVLGTDEGTASYGVSLPAGDYELGGDYFPGNSINQVLFREGGVHPIRLKTVEQKFVAEGAKASYGDVTDFTNYWRGNNLTEFPLIDTSNGTTFYFAWRDNNLTSFPLIDTSSGTDFSYAWYGNNLTSFPLINTSSGTGFSYAWYGNNLTSFPLINTSSGTSFAGAWFSNNLTSFPLIDISSGTSFISAWRDNNLASFPLIDTSSGVNFSNAWRGNNLTSFPLLNTSSATNFNYAWYANDNLTDFPENMFDNCLATNFTNAFLNTGLTQSSIDGILVSINSNGTSNGTFGQSGGSAPSATGEAAINALVTRGWTVTVTGGYQGKVLPEGLFENDENGFWYSMDIGE